MGLRAIVPIILAALAASAYTARAQDYWKLKAGDQIELETHKLYLPESKSIELWEWKDKPVLLMYVQTADPASTRFAQMFEQNAWPIIREKDIACYFVGCGEPASLMAAWAEGNNLTVPVASDGSRKLHTTISNVNGGYPQVILLDKEHRFCAGLLGGPDPTSEQFLKLVDHVIETGYTPPPASQ